MGTANDLISVAAQDVGYSRWSDHEAGTKFGRWYAGKTGNAYYGQSGLPFCAMGVSYWLDKAGIKCAGFPTSGCGCAMNAAIAQGAWHKGNEGLSPSNTKPAGIQPGAVVIFNWCNRDSKGNWDGGHDHVGICTAVNASSISTIEANTGNGQVLRRERAFRYVQGYIVPAFDDVSGGSIEVDGIWGLETTALAQVLAGTYVDGYVDDQNPNNRQYLEACTTGWRWIEPDGLDGGSPLIRAIQRKLKNCGKYYGDIDGLAGQQFASAMIRFFAENWASGATVDDRKLDVGGMTVRAFQRMLNAGKFF